ncbi:hypothetical protein [Chitinophaga qingshengii]|uniref:Uncharacterized protein n=1 Tax=Chitinophaga qingshengii TaxID=1569794 RepID=A0ABR7TJ18_9BACT|nr:hypothetical protein [Chitinophaga qingshengii]MBC9930496.1 hypothetical protein [Chitinophaga qingshengii]
MTVLRYLPLWGLGLLFSVRTTAQQMKLGLQPTQLKKEALLELNSDSQGLLLNRVPKSAITAGGALFNAADGMFVYVTDVTEKCLYIKANGTWKKVADFTFSAGNGINISPAGVISNTGILTFAGRTPDAAGNIAPVATDYSTFYLPYASKLSLQAGTGMKASTNATKDLSTNPSFTLDADNDATIWNAAKLATYPISTTTPAANQVLTFNGTQWEPKAPTGATGNFIVNGTTLQKPASFNIDGYGDIGKDLKVAGDVTIMSKLGMGTTIPKNRVEITGQSVDLGETTFTSGLRLTNIATVTPGTANNKTLSINATGDVIVTQNALFSRKIKLQAGTGVINFAAAGEQDLSADRTWIINVDSAKNIWNANKIQNNPVATTAPKDGEILKWNAASQMYIPGEDVNGGATYGTLESTDIRNADVPDERYRMKIWQGPLPGNTGAGPVDFGPVTGPSGAHAWSVLAFRSGNFTTHLYFDKNTLAVREWKGAVKPLAPGPPTNPWYKMITTQGDKIIGNGGVIFGNQTSDATSEVGQDSDNFYWDRGAKELGIRTSSPAAALDVNGDFKMGSGGTVFSGMFKFQVNISCSNFTQRTQTTQDFTTPTGTPSLLSAATVILNPTVDLTSNTVVISWVRVVNTNTIRVAFVNTGTGGAGFPSTKFNVTIIQ